MKTILATIALLLVITGSILRVGWGISAGGPMAAGALGVFVLLEAWAVKPSGKKILGMAAASAVAAVIFHPHPLSLLGNASLEAAGIVGLLSSLGLLREAAETSPLVQRCGTLMVRQPPGRRYLALTLGTHLIGLILNFGVLPLLGAMITRGNTLETARGDPKIVAIRSQRMLTALLRGFILVTVWSPLSISFAVTHGAIKGVDWTQFLFLQLLLTALLMGLGWWMDRRAFPPPPLRPQEETPGDWGAPLQLLLLVGGVVVASTIVAFLLDTPVVVGAMCVVPVVGVLWTTVQYRSPVPALRYLSRRLTVTMPAFRDEVAILGGAMFLGTVLSAFISADDTARLVSALGLPPMALVVAMAWIVVICAQFGISQIISVTLLGGALAKIGGIPPLAAASGLMGAWALSAGTSPVGASMLIIARLGGVSLTTVAKEWNGWYAIIGMGGLTVWLMGLCWLLE